MKKLITLFALTVIICNSLFSQKKEYKAYIVSDAHFDSQWNWDVQTSINEFIPKTLNQNLFLLAKYPDYVFNFEGGIKYSWMKEYYPLQYEAIKKHITEGRWHVTGSTWDATDANIPSPESLTRNILYGQKFYKNEFGVQGTDIFLPDCFGFGWTLPTIAAHSGLIGFSTQKLQWRHKPFYGKSKIPFEIGLWKGVDGAKIMLVADAHNYTTKWRDEDLSNSNYLMNLAKGNPTNSVYHYYGTGDTGGAPNIQSVLILEKSLTGTGPLKIISATSDQLYKDFLPFDKHPELPEFSGELLMDVHGTGCYTSQAAMKKYNRQNEILADAAERAAVVADWLGGVKYPKQTLTEAWKRFIWHQFHDDLTGTSIPRAYEFSWNDEIISMKQFANVLTNSVQSVSGNLNTNVKGIPVVVFNPLANPVSEVVEVEVNLPSKTNAVKVVNEKGLIIPSQLSSNEKGKTTLLIAANAPACGFVVYDIQYSSSKTPTTLKATENTIENTNYKITLDKNGDIASIVDKITQRELIASGKTIRLALFTQNESFAWPAWEIMKTEIDRAPVSINGNVKISIAENGPVRSALCIERTYNESTFKQYIRLTNGGQDDRIDIYNEIDWQTTNALLKAEFPLNLTAKEAIYDLGVGSVKRGNNTETAYEVYAQKWVDMYDESQNYGVSILNDCKYGWDKPNDNTVRLTLLHTPKTKGGYTYQSKQDFGKHSFTYSIYGHKNDYTQAQTVLKANVLDQKMSAFIADKHVGELGKTFSFVQIDNPNVQLKALKHAEESDEIVVRFYESRGKENQKTSVQFANNIISAKELNGVEDEIGDASFTQNKLNFEMKAFGIKTFKLKLQSKSNQIKGVEFANIPLKYDLRSSSYNAFRSEANFDGKGNSYAAELLPASIDYKGITFKLGSSETFNGLKCKSDTIEIPQGNYNRIYLLAASTKDDIKVQFMVDGKPQDVVVPYYSGFIGQWGHTGHTKGFMNTADIAYIGTHKHSSSLNKDLAYEYTYMFPVELIIPKNAKHLVLPGQSNVVIFSAVAANVTHEITPAVDLLKVNLPDNNANLSTVTRRNLTLGKPIIEKTGQVNYRERAEFAIDDDPTTKWCDNGDSKNKYIVVDLGKVEEIKSWYVNHASIEDLDYITKEYCLQVKKNENDPWKTVDSVFDNTQPQTDRTLSTPQKARFVRLYITKPDQSEGIIARICEFSVF